MRLSATLSAYIGRQFLTWCLAVVLTLLCIVVLFDMIELFRRTGGKEGVTPPIVFLMALAKLPNMFEKAIPFAILFGATITFWRLNRSHELVVCRAAGVSAWQFLMPVAFLATLIGIFMVTIFNPLAATMHLQYKQMEAKYIRGASNLAALSSEGLWFRQKTEDGHYVMHAEELIAGRMELRKVMVLQLKGEDRFAGRIDAAAASLGNRIWRLTDATVTPIDDVPRRIARIDIPTDLTVENIQDSFAPPETISFWSLPGFIRVLQDAGFPAIRHQIYWQSQLSHPLLLCAMVLLAATFALRPIRRGGTAIMLVGGIATGFLLFFMTDVIAALGVSSRIPIFLAAWSPAIVSLLLGASMLFHLEDG